MNRMPALISGIFLALFVSWAGIVGYSCLVLGRMQPLPDEESRGYFPPSLSGLAVAGQTVYAANGCVYCHSQQVRQTSLSTDVQKGLGPRHTVARDFLRSQPAFPGIRRTGPDLSNIGLRQLDPNWHHRHLYDPRIVTEWSIMPSFRYLYILQKVQGQPSEEAIQRLSGPHAPPAGWEAVPSAEAKALVAYLLSLKKNYPLPEAPLPTGK